MAGQGTIIVNGTSQGIGAGVVRAFRERGYNVAANWGNITNSGTFRVSDRLALVAGTIGESAVAKKIVAIARFGSIDALVNNAGIFFGKPFTEFTAEDFEALATVNLKGFLYVTQGSVKQMLTQKRDGSVVNITASQVVNPIARVLASVAMITRGGLEDFTRSLASEYARNTFPSSAVAPGIVDTPMHANNSKDFLTTLWPMGTISSVSDVVDAVVYPTESAALPVRCCTWTVGPTRAAGEAHKPTAGKRGGPVRGTRHRAATTFEFCPRNNLTPMQE